jgi:hypothetical protein
VKSEEFKVGDVVTLNGEVGGDFVVTAADVGSFRQGGEPQQFLSLVYMDHRGRLREFGDLPAACVRKVQE